MRHFAIYGPLLALGANAGSQNYNSTSLPIPSTSSASQQNVLNVPSASPSIIVSSSSSNAISSSASAPLSPSVSALPAATPSSRPSISPVTTSASSNRAPTSFAANITSKASTSSLKLMSLTRTLNKDNSTRFITPSYTYSTINNTAPRCTGCLLQALDPVTTWYKEEENHWTSYVVTETKITDFTTWYNGTKLDGVESHVRTVNQTKTVVLTSDDETQTITRTTPQFTITPTDGVTLTVDAGNTYVIYRTVRGGTDRAVTTTISSQVYVSCRANPASLTNWEPAQNTLDWNYFIETYVGVRPQVTAAGPVALPTPAVNYLQNNLAIKSYFHGSNIATCSYKTINVLIPIAPTRPGQPFLSMSEVPQFSSAHLPHPEVPHGSKTFADPESTTQMTQPVFTTVPAFPSSITPSTGTFLSTTYESTSSYFTRQGCLRCQSSMNNQIDIPGQATPLSDPNIIQASGSPLPETNDNPPNNNQPGDNTPGQNQSQNSNQSPGQTVTIGDTVVVVRPPGVTQNPNTNPNPNPNPNPNSNNSPDRPSEQNVPLPPAIIIGTNTYTPGQSTSLVVGGTTVPVVVPLDGGGTRIVIGGTTIAVQSAPTQPPILKFGTDTITANPQGQFVIGTQILQPGGPAATISGTTISIAPAGSIAIINGITSTMALGPVITPPPILTVGNRFITATTYGGSTQILNNVQSVSGGTTAYVFGPGQTLIPGGVLTISGTTLSMPSSASGSVVVINGVTSTLGTGPMTPAALTIDGKTYVATLRDGTTEYALGQGTTLRPGQAITVSGTTFSLDPKGTALIINGQTSSLPLMPASNSASTTAASSTIARDVGNFVWSGIGGQGRQSTSKGGASNVRSSGLDKWIEGLVMALAGWLITF